MTEFQFVDSAESSESDVNLRIAQERNQDLQKLESDLAQLTEIMQTLAVMVHAQNEAIDQVVAQVEESSLNIEEGVAHLENAAGYSQSTLKTKLVGGAVVCGGVALGGFAIIFLSPIVGLVTAGCGIVGAVACLGFAFSKKKQQAQKNAREEK